MEGGGLDESDITDQSPIWGDDAGTCVWCRLIKHIKMAPADTITFPSVILQGCRSGTGAGEMHELSSQCTVRHRHCEQLSHSIDRYEVWG